MMPLIFEYSIQLFGKEDSRSFVSLEEISQKIQEIETFILPEDIVVVFVNWPVDCPCLRWAKNYYDLS